MTILLTILWWGEITLHPNVEYEMDMKLLWSMKSRAGMKLHIVCLKKEVMKNDCYSFR